MRIEYDANPKQFRGTGAAFMAREPDDRDCFGYWDLLPDALHPHSNRCLDRVPWKEAIEWGQQRTSRILIRPESDPGEYY
jgi:hypothetical protein